MMGEYRVMGIYPKGHLMEFVRPGLDSGVLPTASRSRIWVMTNVSRWPAGLSPGSTRAAPTARCS